MDSKSITTSKSSWFGTDTKVESKDGVGPTADAFRGLGKAAFGTRGYRMVLNQPVRMVATVTTGILSGIISVNPANSSEWTAPSALFEEYKVLGGKLEFCYSGVSGPTSTITSDFAAGFLQVAYDPKNATVPPPTAVSLTSHEQRRAFQTAAPAASVGNFDTPVQVQGSRMSVFRFKVPPGVATDASTAGGSYVNTASPVPFGGVEYYHQTNLATALAVGYGVLYLECEFRNRY